MEVTGECEREGVSGGGQECSEAKKLRSDLSAAALCPDCYLTHCCQGTLLSWTVCVLRLEHSAGAVQLNPNALDGLCRVLSVVLIFPTVAASQTPIGGTS